MTLKLILSLLFIVWGLSSAEEYTNHWLKSVDAANVEFCSHDGYLNKTVCACDTDYSGNFCLNRKCRNFGFDGRLGIDGGSSVGVVDRCICPPGFLGRNCEPVKCVDGAQQTYTRSKNEKMISLLASFNTQMETTWKTGNIGDIVCKYTSYSRNFNYNFDNTGFSIPVETTQEECSSSIKKYLEPDTCEGDEENPADCQLLNVDNLNQLVQNSPPDSIVFVVTNMAASSTNSSLAENIIGTAIAKRIQINVVVYNNSLPRLYASDPSLTYLSNIASATFGTFVLPSVDSNNEQFNIVSTLLDLWDKDIGVSVIYTEEFPTLPIDTSSDIYVAGQTYYSEDLTFNIQDVPPVISKSDFWKLYKIPADSFSPTLKISGQVEGTPIIVYSAGRIRAYSGFTSDQYDSVIDVSYSVSVEGASYPLVFRLESAGRVLLLNDIRRTVGTPQTLSLSELGSRTGCQFGLVYSATCTSVGASVITILTTAGHTVSFPVYCASSNFATNVFNNLIQNTVEVTHLAKRQSLAKDIVCTNTVDHETVGQRSFVIICENTRDPDESKSSVDNVFRNKNSVFYQLTSYISSSDTFYKNFVAALNQAANSNLIITGDYGKFITKIMTATNNSPNHIVGNPVDVTQLLTKTIQATNSYSDILFVVNYDVLTDDVNPTVVKEALAVKQSRLYVIFVQTYSNTTDKVYEYMNDLTVSSGGVAVRVNDYTDLNKFVTQYFPLLVANDIVAKSYSENMKAGIALNNVSMTTDQHILLVTNQDLSGDGIVNATVTVDGIDIVALPQIGELQLFTLTPRTASNYDIRIFFSTSGFARLANAVLLANSANPEIISLSFMDKDNKNRNDVVYREGKFTPYFYSSVPFSTGSFVTVTYSDPQNPTKPVYSGNIINVTDNCDSNTYSYTTDFSWVCSISGGLYHFKIDRVTENGTITRTFPITCLGDDSGDCLNGGTAGKDGVCTCLLEWSGTHCESPLCQNGGIKTDADTCDCLPGLSGDFCEICETTCGLPSPTKPEYLSDLSSLFIVADTEALKVSNLSSGLDITGVPINVVLYGDGNGPRLVQSTTNGQHVVEFLGTPTGSASNTSESMYSAISFALDNQFTSRSLIVVLTSNPDSDVDGDLLIRLAAKRAEIRILSTSATTPLSSNHLTLLLVGNGVPYVIQNDGFEKYLQNYIVPLFTSLKYVKAVPQRVFNVFQTGTVEDSSVNIEIPKDSTFDNAQSEAFIHVYYGRANKGDSSGSVGNTAIYSLPFSSNEGASIVISQNSQGVTAFYSIEVVSYLKTGYGFNNDTNGANEVLNSGVSFNQTNVITISPAPDASLPTSNPGNFPYLLISEIVNGTLSNATTVLFTRKSGKNCFFTYFATLNVCSQNSTIGYQAQLITRTDTMARQQQFVLTCHKTSYQNHDTSCGEMGSPYKTCECDSGFTGIDCSHPICENGGVRDDTVCRCPLPYYGRHCENSFFASSTSTLAPSSTTTLIPSSTTTSTPSTTTLPTTTPSPQTRVVAFIIDVVGTDDYAYNQTSRSIVEYVNAFGNIDYVMLVGNWNVSVAKGFQQYASADALSTSLSTFWTLRKITANSKIASVSKSLTKILNSYTNNKESLADAVSMNIFYTTQIGLSDDDDPAGSLGGLEAFERSSIVFSPFAVTADQTILDSLEKFSPNKTKARDFYNGVKAMVSSTNQNDGAVLPAKPNYSCVYGMQTNINVPIDRSASTSTTIAANLKTFLVNFRESFNYIENDESSRCKETSLPDYYNERTAMTSFVYYDGFVKPATFCPSQYSSYINFEYDGKNASADYSSKTVKYIGKYINQNNCVCNRFDDDSTFKYIIWLPRSSAPLQNDGTDLLPMLKLNTTNAYHFVVPFYDVADKNTDLFYQILVDQDTEKQKGADWYLLPNADKTDVNEIIATLNEKLCEIAGVDPTAVPVDSLHSMSRHNDIYSQFWN